MTKSIARLMIGTAALALGTGMGFAQTMVIGHFGDPTPLNAARAVNAFEAATGWDIEWRQFASGTDVIAAMASGDVLISELGSSPLAIAASQGVDLQMFMLSYVIGDAESLIARNGSGISSLEDLRGKRVAVPVGSTAHFSLVGALAHAGIAESELTIMNMPPDQIAAAWEQDAIDAAFIWHPVQSQLLQNGTRLVGAGDVAEWGYPTFNAWVVNAGFAADNVEAVAAFARAMDEANAAYTADPAAWTVDSAPVQAVASMTGAEPGPIPEILEGFTFVPLGEQLSGPWLTNAAAIMQSTAEFLQAAGRIDSAADDYSRFVNTAIAEAAVN
ncbi:MAG: ABC transporter substrate-binding protein [Pararhodobacter sp.]|nr:ABC transporter substrate-binding protein [Pararhodobacter sp.]